MDRKVKNRRQTSTKASVHAALLALLEEKAIDHISILELCKRAAINRTTFYNHYGSQYDVLDEMVSEYLENTARSAQKSVGSQGGFQACLVDILTYMGTNLALSRLILLQNPAGLRQLLLQGLPDFGSRLMGAMAPGLSRPEKEALAVFIQAGAVGIILQWLQSGCALPPEDTASLIMRTLGRVRYT